MKKVFLIMFLAIGMMSCTKQDIAKNYGGTYTVELPKGKKLINATWKDSELWFLTRDRRSNETPETYQFKEDSNWDVLEGTVLIVEQ
jgi:hypothetical protein